MYMSGITKFPHPLTNNLVVKMCIGLITMVNLTVHGQIIK